MSCSGGRWFHLMFGFVISALLRISKCALAACVQELRQQIYRTCALAEMARQTRFCALGESNDTCDGQKKSWTIYPARRPTRYKITNERDIVRGEHRWFQSSFSRCVVNNLSLQPAQSLSFCELSNTNYLCSEAAPKMNGALIRAFVPVNEVFLWG